MRRLYPATPSFPTMEGGNKAAPIKPLPNYECLYLFDFSQYGGIGDNLPRRPYSAAFEAGLLGWPVQFA